MKEIRCSGKKTNGDNCNNLLFKVNGEDYEIETICRKCGHKDVYTYPTTLSIKNSREAENALRFLKRKLNH